jgi:PAS domain S-box-containing protein
MGVFFMYNPVSIFGDKQASTADSTSKVAVQELLQTSRSFALSSAHLQHQYADSALRLATQIHDARSMMHSHIALAEALENQDIYGPALLQCQRAALLAQVLQDSTTLATSYRVFALLHRNLFQYDSSIFYAQQAIQFFERTTSRTSPQVEYARALGELGQTLVRQKRYDDGLRLFQQVLRIAEQFHYQHEYIMTIRRIGYLYALRGDIDSALAYHHKALKIGKNLGLPIIIADGYSQIGSALLNIQRYDEALSYLQQANALADSTGVVFIQQDVALALSRVFEAKNDAPKAVQYYKQFVELSQHMSGDSTTRQILWIKKFEEQLKDQELLSSRREAASERKLNLYIAAVGALGITSVIAFAAAIVLSLRTTQNREIQQREEQFRLLAENTSDAVGLHDVDSTYLYVSPSLFAMTGHTTEDILGRKGHTFVHPDDLALASERLASLIRTKQAKMVILRFRLKNGEYKWLEVLGKPVIGDDGEVKQFVTSARDVSDRIAAEAALRERELQLTAVVESTEDAIYSVDARYRLLTFNSAFIDSAQQALGVEITTGMDVMQLLPDALKEERMVWKNTYDRCLAGERFSIVYSPPILGEKMFYEQTYNPIRNEHGVVIGVVAFSRDITKVKQTELLIQEQVRELEAKNAEMERFMYTVSHDLKSPLITIKGFLGMIAADVKNASYSTILSDLARIENAAEKMQNLLEDLLELSRIGRVVKPSEQFSLSEVALETVELLHGILTTNDIHVKVQPMMPSIVADKARFREVLQNLIENAAKFMGTQPEPHIEIGVQTDDVQPIFFVRDNGIGIDKQYHEQIFGLFDKLDNRSNGTGIGLALVKRIIELHGGRIWVESAPQQGATFYFTCGRLADA